MTRNEAAHKVNEAFKAAKVTEALSDPKAKGFSGTVEGHSFSYNFKYGAHAHEQRKHEIAEFRLALVNDLLAIFPVRHLTPVAAEPVSAEEPVSTTTDAPATTTTAAPVDANQEPAEEPEE